MRLKPKPGERSEPWLLIKAEDAFARQPGAIEITDEATTSPLSGLTDAELAATAELRTDHQARTRIASGRKLALPDIAGIRGARKGLLPAFVEPCLAAPCEQPPSGPKWIHEIKHDGYRIQARIEGRSIRLLTRKALDWTERFRAIADALADLRLGSALIDGEIVVEDEAGLTSLNQLQADLKSGRQDRFRYFVFDLLYCEGFDLTGAALIDRKALLARLLQGLPANAAIRLSEHLEADGAMVLEHSCRLGLEGIISKRKDLPHRPGRGDIWLKAKCRRSEEFVILGYVPSTAARRSIGALALGYHEGERLAYAELDALRAPKPKLLRPLPAGADKGVVWTEARLVGAVEFRDWTSDGLIRQASFKGLREDKAGDEAVLEAPRRAKKARVTPAPPVTLTHPERILWPVPGITKHGLADFYTDIAEWILPHIAGRVLSLKRCPSGVDQKGFFAKHAWSGLAPEVARIDVGEKEPMLAINDLAGLLSLVQANVVEIHPWGSRADRLEHPDRLIFDLDPAEDVPWHEVTEAAIAVREHLVTLGLESFVKTTGGKGLHVVVPVQPTLDWPQAKAFTAAVATTLAKRQPDRYVATMSKQARRGRIFIDYFRNDRGATAVTPYSTRASDRATVSTPLAWEELSEGLRSDHFTVDNLRHRLGSLRHDPWAGFFKLRQRIPVPR